MPKHARNRSLAKRMVSVRGAVVVGTFAALSCGIVTGTASAATPEKAPAKSTVTAKQKAEHKAAKRTYTVKKGDTLIGIARHHKVTGGWKGIAARNHIHSPYIIHPGQVLHLPHAPAAKAPAAKAPAPAAKASTTTTAQTASTATAYPDNLDGWINHSLAIMKQRGIPGSYDGIYRNIIRESSGNPNAINLWDSNAAAGTPSIGLLQVIQPTFDAYHVPGTSTNIYDPVANITAACNYAYHVYGSIDNVNGPY
ncbi:LysM peptidoglycan-binding domain-containing protein [Streptomyces sp. NRRL F-5123]|uniref:LysM peptidoglycan-binding domain-containing protein n=1 Tax=Streptomyces sp. NRRL F-5123 TaxID=1463856 RepID=UPI0004E0E481|nr:LysM peptidoglycan-binding domain-containing protein [Streptomyces sp. NRRL F-5123]